MLEPRRAADLLLQNVARVLTYVAFGAIAAAAAFIFVMVLEQHG
jgi:sulfite exporter TauE/SafE